MMAVPVVRACVVLDAPRATVAGALRSVQVLQDSMRPLGHRIEIPGRAVGLLEPEDVLRLRVRALGVPFWLAMRVVRAGPDGQETRMQSGPFADVQHSISVRETPGGSRISAQLRWQGCGALADRIIFRRLAGAFLQERLTGVRAAVDQMAGARQVVAGAIIRDATVLLARRRWPLALAGQWELPGGAVEPGEEPAEALRRELTEELGVRTHIGARLGSDVPLPDGRVLRAYHVTLRSGDPQAREHSALRWVRADDLWSLDMVANDRGWRPELAALLNR